MITIGLCMIMKDESKVLHRVLNSIYPILDYYTVVDTGSSDNSIEIVRQFFGSKNIPGEIHNHTWNNYGDARNFAIDRAKGKTDFNFTIDCDNVLHLGSEFRLSRLKEQLERGDLGVGQVKTGNIIYGQRMFWRNDKPFRYKYPTHEILLCPDQCKEVKVTDLFVSLHPDGKSWENSKQKFLNNAVLLIQYMEQEGLDPRCVFYIGESYKDAGDLKKAIEWYARRVELKDGFTEERYWSQLMIAELKWRLEYPLAEVADEFMKCNELDSLRAEHLHSLKFMYLANDRPRSASQITQLLKQYDGKNPYPKRSLFIRPECYQKK